MQDTKNIIKCRKDKWIFTLTRPKNNIHFNKKKKQIFIYEINTKRNDDKKRIKRWSLDCSRTRNSKFYISNFESKLLWQIFLKATEHHPFYEVKKNINFVFAKILDWKLSMGLIFSLKLAARRVVNVFVTL